MPASQRDALIVEHGLVETCSVILYLVGAALLVTSRQIERVFGHWTAGILLLCTAREMDAQKAFTSDSITKSRYYIDPSIPLSERLVVAAVVLLLMLLIVLYVRRYWRSFAAALSAREAFAWSIAAAIALGPVSKLLDGAHRMTEDLTGAAVSEKTRMQLMAFEEVFELGIPLLVLCAIAPFVLRSRSAPVRRRGTSRSPESDRLRGH